MNPEEIKPTIVSTGDIKIEVDAARVKDKWCATFHVDGWPNETKPGIIEPLTSHWSSNVDVTIDVDPMNQNRAINVFQRKCNEIETKKLSASSSAEKRKHTRNFDRHEEILDQLEEGSESIHHVGVYVTVWGESRREMRDLANDVVERMGQRRVMLQPVENRELQGLITTSPIKQNALKRRQHLSANYEYTNPMLGSGVGALYPFTAEAASEKGGIFHGYNSVNGSTVSYNVYNRDNGYNVLVLGELGAGKSYGVALTVLREIIRRGEILVIIMDPRGGFRPLVNELNGSIHSVGGDTTINPLETSATPERVVRRINEEEGGSFNPWNNMMDSKMSFWKTFFEQMDDDDGMDGDMRSVLRRAMHRLYVDDCGIVPGDPKSLGNESPTVPDLVNKIADIEQSPRDYLRNQESDNQAELWEHAAAKLQSQLEPFRKGYRYGSMAQKTSIDMYEANPIYFDMSGQEESRSTDLSMKLVYDAVYNRIKESEVPCITVIDEFHYLLENSDDLEWLENSIRHSRHFDNSVRVMSQNADDFFTHRKSKSIASLMSSKLFFHVPEAGMNYEQGKSLDLTDQQVDMVRKLDYGSATSGYSQALIQVDGMGTYPVDIVSTDAEEVIIDPEAAKKSGAAKKVSTYV